MEQFIWQNKSWPHFFWNPQSIIYPLADLYKKQGFLEGLLKQADDTKIKNLAVSCFTSEILNSYKLDDLELNESFLKGIISKKLNLDCKMPVIPHNESEIIETTVSVFFDILTSSSELTLENLISWNKQLSSAFYKHTENTDDEKKISDNDFRTEEYSYKKDEKICYTAPSPKSLESEMEKFINWFNKCDSFQELDKILKSAITQFYIIAVRPFDKANNILARMLSYKILYNKDCYGLNPPKENQQFNIIISYLYSITEQTVKYHKDYNYMLLQLAQGNLDMTIWISWYIKNSILAINKVIKNLDYPLNSEKQKTQEIQNIKQEKIEKPAENNQEKSEKPKPQKRQKKSTAKTEKPLLNKRQQAAIEYMKTDADNKISTSEYSKILNCSQDTASRDIEKLMSLGLIEKGDGKGKNTYYFIKK